ncbi:hypothetical protein Tco_0296352 [Tanacetum coccineum]
MSSASTVTYTSVYTDSEPGRVFWGADEELFDGGSPRVIVYGYDGLPMQPVAPPSPDYVPGLEHPPFPDYVPGLEHPPSHVEEDQPLPVDASPVALSLSYVADSDPEEDPEEDLKEDHVDYPADRGDDDDEPSNDDEDDDDTEDEDEEPFKDEDDDEEEEEHLAPADSSAIHVVSPIPSAGDTLAFETHEAAPTPVEVERLLALPIPPPSPLPPWSSPLPQIPSPPLPPPPSSLHLPPHVPTSLPLPSSPLPPSLFIPPPVDRKEDIPEAELPPRKRLCPTVPTSRRQRAEEVGYRIRDVWVDPTEAVEEDRQTQLSQRVDVLVKDRQFHYKTARLLDQEALVSREAWAHSVGLSSAVHYELHAYRTHTQMQDYRIAS